MRFKTTIIYFACLFFGGLILVAVDLIYGDVFNKNAVYGVLFGLGLAQVMAVLIMESKLGILEVLSSQSAPSTSQPIPVSPYPQYLQPQPPEKNTFQIIADDVYKYYKSGVDLDLIRETLVSTGYDPADIDVVINKMYEQGLIKKEEPKIKIQMPPEEVEVHKAEDIEPPKEPPKKEEKYKCSLCEKGFDKMNGLFMHIRKAHPEAK